MTKTIRRSKFISFMLVLAVLLCGTAFAFADDTEPLGFYIDGSGVRSELVDTYSWSITKTAGIYTYVYPSLVLPNNELVKYYNNDTATIEDSYIDIMYYRSNGGALGNMSATSLGMDTNFIEVLKGTYENGNFIPVTEDGVNDNYPYLVIRYSLKNHINGTSSPYFKLSLFSTRTAFTGLEFKVDKLVCNGQLVIGASDVPVTYYTYKFNVPSGQMLHIIADGIQDVHLNYKMGFGLFRSNTLTMLSNRYNYAVSDYASLSAFSTSNIVQWSKLDSSNYGMTIEHDNSNALNFYNFVVGDNERSNNYEVYITCTVAKAYMYSQDWKGAIVESTSSSGAIFLGGGNGTTDQPFNAQLYDTSENAIYTPSTLNVDTTAQDSALNSIVNALSLPSQFIHTVTESTGNFMKTISTFFGWLPVELTSIVVGAFSVIIAVGVLKMFL